MHQHSYIYSFKYDTHNVELCQLESRQLFNEQENNKLLFSNIKIDPSISPFIKNRFEIIASAEDYQLLLNKVKQENIHMDGFKAEYMVLHGDKTNYTQRLDKLKDIGYCIEGDPDYVTPLITYSICYYNNTWYFGELIKHDTDWFKHKKKPYSFSSAINMDIAKALVSIVSKGNKSKRLLDAGCGVGTVMLEACIGGFAIEGCDIHWKACQSTRKNLAHYAYTANVYRSDLQDLEHNYDAAIIDLPYNLFSHSDDENALYIIQAAIKRSPRLVIVSTSDISSLLSEADLKLVDSCSVEKKGKKFTRKIWVCEMQAS
ncbi:TRM11 family methyltransferase [Carboxylicivirga sp. M1479]|uniref:TRM11 family SAM-dependent methyltransferase n=1 Tax=Carboxylicivirga sp. M1479 TaxID=2594476 RepID=UPI001177A985|nr:methyltransferase [Carboxylicivirga sp. M1479]TRX66173.1 methyltransferase [Carboxylicivirga sp. M1479]